MVACILTAAGRAVTPEPLRCLMSLERSGWIADGGMAISASGHSRDDHMTAFGIGQIVGFLVLALLVAGVVSELVKRRRGGEQDS